MPFINVYLRRGTTPEYRHDVSRGLHRAMVDVLGIPEDDQFHVFHEVEPDNFRIQPVVFGLPRGERAMFVQFCFNQRPAEQKAALFAAVVENLRHSPGVPAEDLLMTVLETARENWWAAGRTVDPATGYDERMTPPTPTP
ncbi:tautomerase family protein [Streptomyces sp. NPDC023723]|uniref:tautomerase family protein n=1 Tax=Streptomyces sp. NPDC023723 TaxID=3154323 RepID=UPI0033FE7CF8